MKLNTNLLADTYIGLSKNELLEGLYDLVLVYNGFPDGVTSQARLDVLERIMLSAGLWMTSKPPTGTAMNDARWNALDNLATQCVGEGLRLGAKFLKGPTNMKTIKKDPKFQSYWLEALSGGHQPGFVLSEHYEKWLTKGTDKGRTYSFWNYIGATKKKNGHPRVARIAGAQSVRYLSKLDAEPYRVYFDAGRALMAHDNAPFDTRTYRTAHSGDGWAIFVVSTEGELYAGSHITGEFHHSSFLSGGPVIAAGELVSEDGDIKFITAKSGHYGPAAENLRAMVTRLIQIPGDAVVMPRFITVPPAYRVADFRANATPAKVKRADVMASLPAFARSPNAVTMVNKTEA